MADKVEIFPVTGVGEVAPGSNVAQILLDAITAASLALKSGDVVVVTHKIVSKAEGRTAKVLSDADYRRLVAEEAADVIRRRGDLVITRTHHGFVCANAAVDRSNTPHGTAVLLPTDPDRSAHRIRVGLERGSGTSLGVLITDTFGRAWRRGQTDVAIGMSGVTSLLDLRGHLDHEGRELTATEVAVADELAGAADLVMGKAARIPVALARGTALIGDGRAADLVRDPQDDLFL